MGPKHDSDSETKQQDKLDELIDETNDLANDIRETFELGKSTYGPEFDSQKLKLFKARLSRLDATFEKFTSFSYEAKLSARYLKNELAGQEIKSLNDEIRHIYYEALALHIPEEETSKLETSNTCSTNYTLKLPVINIPSFDGEISKWASFKDTFVSLIHENKDLSLVQKFHYLKSSLSGVALQTISAIPITELGYPQAWDTLTKKFDNKRIQAAHCLAKIFNFNPIGRAGLSVLQDFSTTVLENAIRFKNLDIADGEGFILMTFALRLLDHRNREKFETEHLGKTEIPTFSQFTDFIHNQVSLYQTEFVNSGNKDKNEGPSKGSKIPRKVFISTESKSQGDNLCVLCKRRHRLYRCPIFLKLTPRQRFDKLRSLKCRVCMNCLMDNHVRHNCPSDLRCQKCTSDHHTLLHFPSKNKVETEVKQEPRSTPQKVKTENVGSSPEHPTFASTCTGSTNIQPMVKPSSSISHCAIGESYVLLGTAIGRVQDCSGTYQEVRILLDNGAQRSFVTSACANKLGLRLVRNSQTLSGFGNQPIQGGKHQTNCRIIPQRSRFPEILLSTVVTPVITGPMPVTSVPQIQELYNNLNLADQSFWKSGEVDILIGADGYGLICNGNIHKTCDNGPYALDTIFGWVVMGPTGSSSTSDSVTLLTSLSSAPLENLLQNFWEIEDVSKPLNIPGSPEDDACEKHYSETHSRDSTGRYVVRLPFKTNNVSLGKSYPTALRRFFNLEFKLNKNIPLKEEYNKVLEEYLTLGYMSTASRKGEYYLPHHGVTKESTTTRLRVVFDASMKTSLGSLNDKLYTGPKLHQDIRIVLVNFRRYPIALTADIRHMYLQILMHPDDRIYQHILYRFNTAEPIRTYELNRLTFGLSSAPYLAQRTIRQLINDEGSCFPLASDALLNFIYMDDILTGAYTKEAAVQIQQELITLLLKGGFKLQKWASNCADLLEHVTDSSPCKIVTFSEAEDSSIKILGMQWDPHLDCLFYAIKTPPLVLTKRAVLSVIARIFDPLGYLAPVVFKAKSFLQQLWNCKLGWDVSIPDSLASPWKDFVSQLKDLESIQIPRCLFSSIPHEIKLIGFADASSLGYAAVLYLRISYPNTEVSIKLLSSKTRLAPIKTISIPRLELCAALLLVRLIDTYTSFLSSLTISSQHLFSDSTVVLSWLRLPPNTLKIFVANRITEILSHSKASEWYHVNTKQNSADSASRGLAPKDLINNTLWWFGPQWLLDDPVKWPVSSKIKTLAEVPELVPQKCVLVSLQPSDDASIRFMQQYSTLDKLVTTVAYCLRFIHNTKSTKENRRLDDTLNRIERHDALQHCIKIVQQNYLTEEIELVSKGLGHKSKVKSLSPFIDHLGVLRVGGRLSQSPLHYDAKHPMLLPSKCHLTNLIIDYLHLGYLHAGPTLLLSLLNRHYWVIAGRRVVRQRIRQCLVCRRERPTTLTPYMADLPSSRFKQGRAFLNVGVDFAGPFLCKESRLRKSRVTKCYMCIFVCMSTKAVHLDLVSNLTTDAFLGCLDRFVARRGIPSKIFSDHGTNFVGADRHLKTLYQWLREKDINQKINKYMVNHEIRWEYSPPTASHMSGLWEAGVKSAKSHLNRVLNGKTLTFEELSTLLARIEAILNSRPLYPTSTSPDDYSVLTPGHFLIGDALVAPPEYDFTDTPINRLTRWELLNRCIQQIWNRWRLDYLNSLQHRVKWVDRNAYNNLTPGTLVLLKDSHVAPTLWPTARIIEVYPGKDSIVRVVKVRTVTGEYVRPVSKIVLLLPENLDLI